MKNLNFISRNVKIVFKIFNNLIRTINYKNEKKITNKSRIDFNSCSVYTLTYSCNTYYVRKNGRSIRIR